MKKILMFVMCMLIATPTLTSCGSSKRCKTSKMKKKWAKNNYWKSSKKHKKSKWGR